MKSEPRGYGKVLYILHENGYTTVYAHLDEFAPKIKARTPAARYFDVFLSAPLPVEKGETIAFTGETGAGLPHLHFEVRRGFAHPVEPFSAGLEPVNDALPVPDSITLYPATPETRIHGSPYPAVFAFVKQPANSDASPDPSGETAYILDEAPRVTGSVYFELTAHQPGSTPTSRRGISGWKLAEVGRTPPLFCSERKIETFDYLAPDGLVNQIFNPARSHIGPTFFTYRLYPVGSPRAGACSDPVFKADGKPHSFRLDLFTESGLQSEATFRVVPEEDAGGAGGTLHDGAPAGNSALSYTWNPGNAPGIHVSLLKDHMLVTAQSDDSPAVLEIRSNDATVLESKPDKVTVASIPLPPPGPLHFSLATPFSAPLAEITTRLYEPELDHSLDAVWGNVALRAPAGSFLRDTPVLWMPVDLPAHPRLPFVTPPFNIEPLGEPLRRPALLQLSSPEYAPDTGLYHWDPFVYGWRFLGSVFSENTAPAAPPAPGEAGPPAPNFVSISILHFDTYAVLKDEVPPVIYAPGVFRKRMAILITDVGMGVNDERVFVTLNGKPVAGDYDPDRAWFLTDLPYSKFVGKGKLKVVVFDRGGNRAQKTFSLRMLTP